MIHQTKPTLTATATDQTNDDDEARQQATEAQPVTTQIQAAYILYNVTSSSFITLSPRKAEKPASPTVTNSRKAETAWRFRKKLLKIMLCL